MSNKYDKLVKAIDKDEDAARNEPHVFVLSEEDKKVLTDVIYKGLCTHFDESIKRREAKDKKNEEDYEAARSKQGLSTVEEVNIWAPKYSPTVQRWMRWIGRQLFSREEDPDKVHGCLKTVGNALQTMECQEPSLKDYLRPKLERLKRCIKLRRYWSFYGCIILILIAAAYLCNYQSKVMYIERKNAIIRYHFRNDKAYQKEYQYIDSLIHNYGVYDAYETIRKSH